MRVNINIFFLLMSNMSILYPDKNFDFTKIKLSNPNGVQGGSYFCKLTYDDEELLIQTPKIFTKNGILTTGKKIYTDLQLTKGNEEMIDWLDNLEKYLQNIIFEKKNVWFQNDLTLDDIEYFFNKTYRSYKNSNYLIRTFVKQSKNFKNIETFTIYNDKEELLSINDVTKDHKIISIVEIAGIKFTNSDFRVEINLKQVMVFQNTLAFNKCLIKSNLEESKDKDTLEEHDEPEVEPKPEPETEEQPQPETEEHDEPEVEPKPEPETEEQPQPETEEQPQPETEEQDQPETEEQPQPETEEQPQPETEHEPEETKKLQDNLEEISLEIPKELESINLKSPSDIYLELYKNTLEKAKLAKENAIKCFLQAKQIKNKYLLDSVEFSDNESEILESLTED